MKILIALPLEHQEITSIDDIIYGTALASGTIGSIVRVADFLAAAGYSICLSSAFPSYSNKFSCIIHDNIDDNEFDQLIVHQSHWNGSELTFGNQALTKTSLWFHNETAWSFLHNFWQKGGSKAIFPSLDCANAYRALPQWKDKARVIYNSYCPVFQPKNDISQQAKLLFIGAITPTKGFREVMKLWSYLVQKKVDLQLVIAGSIRVHSSSLATGSMGIGEFEFETNEIQPWLKSLPENYKPNFLGALCPVELCSAISQSWAVLVNPSWQASETFCCSAVEAQACERTVFSVKLGGLKETVYQGEFISLSKTQSIENLGNLIINGLENPDVFTENGNLSRHYIEDKFNSDKITQNWIKLLNGQPTEPALTSSLPNLRDYMYDMMRTTRLGMPIKYIYGRALNRLS